MRGIADQLLQSLPGRFTSDRWKNEQRGQKK
jgi:hypothetical protein